jgi:hypothetical protein
MMDINRNNYETFLLLYIDGELKPTEKVLVEQFLLNNPDLQLELDLLQSTKLTADFIEPFDKTALYKTATNNIHLNNYEEKFLLYADKELSANEAALVEKFVLQHPHLQNEFTSITASVLAKEEIHHPNKENLYKKERKPIIALWVQQFAVAASILFLSIAVWNFNVKKSNITQKQQIDIAQNSVSNNNNASNKTQQKIAPIEQLVKNNTSAATRLQQEKNVQQNNYRTTVQYANQQQPIKTTQNNIVNTNYKTDKATNTIASYQVHNIVAIETSSLDIPIPVQNISTTNNTIVQAVNTQPIYKYLDTDAENTTSTNTQNDVVYIGSFKVAKSKVKNVLNKTKAFFGNQKDNTIDKAIATIL